MLERFFGGKIHAQMHVFSLAALASGLAWGKAVMSISFVLLIANFLLECNFQRAYLNLKKNKFSWVVFAFFLIYFIGLLWTDNIGLGLKEIKSRLPMFVIPFIIIARPELTLKELHIIFYSLIVSLLLTSLINFALYYNWIGENKHTDIREMSHFGSHIRYAVLIVLGCAICIYLYLKNRKYLIAYVVMVLWFVFYTFVSEVLTGLVSLGALVVSTTFYFLWKWRFWSAALFSIIVALLVGYLFLTMENIQTINYDLNSLPRKTINGNPYIHSNKEHSEINGLPIDVYRCDFELAREWDKVSKFSFFGKDRKHHFLKNTLVRYMTALELTKDSVGFQKLVPEDIRNIENGYVYPSEKDEYFLPRIQGIRFQLMNRNDPNGHSMLQRFEYWGISKTIITENCLFGVGTGGNARAFELAYANSDTKLSLENQLRSHNMFLSYWISFGVLGIVSFLLLQLVLMRFSIRINYLFGFQFVFIFSLSCLIEDTLETQMGVTIFGLFVGVLLNQIRIYQTKVVS